MRPSSSPATVTAAAEVPQDPTAPSPIDRELDRIRQRREGRRRFFRGTFDDWTLLFGLIAGVVFFGGIALMSAGTFAADSVVVDETLSSTPLDKGEQCIDRTGEVYFDIWASHDEVFAQTHNAPESGTVLVIDLLISDGDPLSSIFKGGLGDIGAHLQLDDGVSDGEYQLVATLWASDSADDLSSVANQDDYDSVSSSLSEARVKEVSVSVKEGSIKIIDTEPRSCWTIEGLGEWGWNLMAAEWGGGRETAMLWGGSAGIPAWWLAFVSLGMSIFFLCVQYPLMHRLYHRDTADLLSTAQMRRLIERTIRRVAEDLRFKVDFDRMKLQDRPISIDVYLPYRTTGKTIATPVDVRAEITKHLLEEYAIFGEMRPLQLKVVCTDSVTSGDDLNSLDSNFMAWGSNRIPLAEDYSDFFTGMSAFGKLESAGQESLARWFRKHDLVDFGTAIMADEEAVFVRVIYRPVQRFAYFLFKPSYKDLQDDLEEQLSSDLTPHLSGRSLVVSARNEKSTLADRAIAGRVEQGVKEFTGEAMVAKRGGIAGALLQNPFMGDILSSVEYVAHKNQGRIDRYGYWGLIVFVWIPFMASGVLVGAMLGLVARMPFERVFAACLIGGTAASLTWAYTARGIIEFMERYHAEVFLPILLFIAVAFTWLKVRDNRIRRREELFRDSMAFFAGASKS